MTGDTTESEFLHWLHQEVGHSGRDDLQDLVEMSDIYTLNGSESDQDLWFDTDPAAAEARAYVHACALRLLDDEAVEPRSPQS